MRKPFPRYNRRRRGSKGLYVFNGQYSCQQRAAATAASQCTSSAAFASAARPCSKELNYQVTKSTRETPVGTQNHWHHPAKHTGCAMGCSFVSCQLLFTHSITHVQPLWLSSGGIRHSFTLTLETGSRLSLTDFSNFQGAAASCVLQEDLQGEQGKGERKDNQWDMMAQTQQNHIPPHGAS